MKHITNPVIYSFRGLGRISSILLLIGITGITFCSESSELAPAIIKDSKWNAGICVDMGNNPTLAIELAKVSRLEVYRIEKNAASAGKVRK